LNNTGVFWEEVNIWLSIDEVFDAAVRKVASIAIAGFEILSNTIREIISSVMAGNVCSEPQNNSYEFNETTRHLTAC
jgi:hypothetical protein